MAQKFKARLTAPRYTSYQPQINTSNLPPKFTFSRYEAAMVLMSQVFSAPDGTYPFLSSDGRTIYRTERKIGTRSEYVCTCPDFKGEVEQNLFAGRQRSEFNYAKDFIEYQGNPCKHIMAVMMYENQPIPPEWGVPEFYSPKRKPLPEPIPSCCGAKPIAKTEKTCCTKCACDRRKGKIYYKSAMLPRAQCGTVDFPLVGKTRKTLPTTRSNRIPLTNPDANGPTETTRPTRRTTQTCTLIVRLSPNNPFNPGGGPCLPDREYCIGYTKVYERYTLESDECGEQCNFSSFSDAYHPDCMPRTPLLPNNQDEPGSGCVYGGDDCITVPTNNPSLDAKCPSGYRNAGFVTYENSGRSFLFCCKSRKGEPKGNLCDSHPCGPMGTFTALLTSSCHPQWNPGLVYNFKGREFESVSLQSYPSSYCKTTFNLDTVWGITTSCEAGKNKGSFICINICEARIAKLTWTRDN